MKFYTLICKLFGHRLRAVRRGITHKSFGVIEQKYICQRCWRSERRIITEPTYTNRELKKLLRNLDNPLFYARAWAEKNR